MLFCVKSTNSYSRKKSKTSYKQKMPEGQLKAWEDGFNAASARVGITTGRLQAASSRTHFSPFLFLPSSFVTFCGAITFCGELRLELGFPDSLLMMEPFWLGDRLQVTIATREAVSSSQTWFQGYFLCTACTAEFSSLVLHQSETEYERRAQRRKGRSRLLLLHER